MFYERLPYDRLMILAGLSSTVDDDVAALEELAAYCKRADLRVISPELLMAFVPSQARRRRLHRAGLIHDPDDPVWCQCGAPSVPGCWSLHAPVLAACIY